VCVCVCVCVCVYSTDERLALVLDQDVQLPEAGLFYRVTVVVLQSNGFDAKE
jgi:hypothetical protein